MRIRRLATIRKAQLPAEEVQDFHGRKGFTLTELMVSLAILVVVSGGIISSHWFGLRMFEITRTQLGANESTRKAMSQLVDEVRSATSLQVGQGTPRSFAPAGVDTPQQGNAIQLYSSTNVSVFIRYFWDRTDQQLKRVTENPASVSVLAQGVSNPVVFTCQDFTGTVLTNCRGSYVLGVRLQFSELQEPRVPVGPGNYYDSYQLQAKISRRAAE